MSIISDELDRIAFKLLNSKIGVNAILKAARNPKNPLHEYFDWNDHEASKKQIQTLIEKEF